jgi:hypothetical protein
VVEAISATQGTSGAYQANFAAMQQMLIQQMFQSADANGNGTISKSEFENFYNQFMGANSASAPSSATTAAADQLYQQLNTAGNGLTLSQFTTAVKLMMSQKAQGHPHHRHGTVAGGTANSGTASPSATGTASSNPTTWLQQILAAGNQNATAHSSPAQNSGGIEFIA